MWLIDVHTLLLRQFIGDTEPYAILSHTWGADEVSFQDFRHAPEPELERRRGFDKIRKTCDQARNDGLDYAWVDTCCINKESSAELSEAINSMFRWYRQAKVCYAYLEDVGEGDVVNLGSSRWFTRGWTLQELVAPRNIDFYGAEWASIGSKSGLMRDLVRITGIDRDILNGSKDIDTVCVAQRMKWAAKRQTTRVEDIAYCLMGIFDVNMPLLYGESSKAFIRLQEEIFKDTEDPSIFAWTASPESAAEQPLRGLLASSPSEFAITNSVTPYRRYNATRFSTISSRVVSLVSGYTLRLSRIGIPRVHAGIDCFQSERPDLFVSVELVSTNGGEYLRSQPDKLFMAPESSLRGTFSISKTHSKPRVKVLPGLLLEPIFCLGPLPHNLQVADMFPRTVHFTSTRLIVGAPHSQHESKLVIKLTQPDGDIHLFLILEYGQQMGMPTIRTNRAAFSESSMSAEELYLEDATYTSVLPSSSSTSASIMDSLYRIYLASRLMRVVYTEQEKTWVLFIGIEKM